MTNPILFVLLANGFAGLTISFVYLTLRQQAHISAVVTKQSIQDEEIEYLGKQVSQLERKLNEILEKQMTNELQTKLDEFVNTHYEIIE